MKYKEERPLANLDAAVKKLLEIANGMEADHAGRFQIGAINAQFLSAGGNVHEYMAAVRAAIRPYRASQSPDWIKVKNRSHPALNRVKDAFA
jgi:hypothetical protein